MAELWVGAGVERDDDGGQISATIGFSPGVGDGGRSDFIIAQVRFLTMFRHDWMKSRSLSRISPGPERKSGWPGLDW